MGIRPTRRARRKSPVVNRPSSMLRGCTATRNPCYKISSFVAVMASADEEIGHAVQVPSYRDVVDYVDRRRAPFGQLVARRRQRPNHRAHGRHKHAPPTTEKLFKGALVRALVQIRDGVMQVRERVKYVAPQRREHHALDDLYRRHSFRFVP